jgi:leucyl-tRNA synthetase
MYNHKKIESKWQKRWEKSGIYKDYGKKKKFYALDMFPYPSGAGLHVGHPKGYIATDVYSRFMMLKGYSVLHPMGWDAFGLPAENYALANKTHPKVAVEENIATFKKQLEKFGFTYDWDREINTTDPEYYKWTQWIFLQMFKKGLAYQSNEPVNWCPKCKTVLANEDLEGGLCERCGTEVVQKKLRQWVLKMTEYADRLLYDLDKEELDWEDSIIEQQKNWIGRSEGVEFELRIKNYELGIKVYTTRIDTVFGMTYAVVAPEHPIIKNLKFKIKNYDEVEKYIERAGRKTELERTELQKEKTGVELKGIKAVNPFNNEEIPLFVADYVLGHYGTGAVMAVPAHDERDWEFARKYNIKIIEVIKSKDGKSPVEKGAFIEDGILINSDGYNGMGSKEAREKMAKWLEEQGIGKKKVNYKMRDWVFSRQRYWGEPIPIIHCKKCGAVGVPEEDLPVKLPDVESYEPTGTGEGPLANIAEWVNTECPRCGGPAKRETNTMPQWAGSSWYYLAYLMRGISNFQFPISKYKEEFDKWLPVDLYVGGAEHATRHLLYARFWHKFLYDIGVVSAKEPFKRLVHVGLINAEDGRKMSKRWNNVINPDDIIEKFGADSIRLYEMFMGPFTQNIAWSTEGVKGVRRFLERVWKIQSKVESRKSKVENKKLEPLFHKTIKKVTEDIENFRFNTAISQMMIMANALEKEKEISIIHYSLFIILLSPFAPHIAEELWSSFAEATEDKADKKKYQQSIFKQRWPEYNPELIKEETINLVIQVNGKTRDIISVSADITEDEAKKIAQESDKVKKWIKGKKIVKVIFVKGKLVNIVAK